MRRNVCDGVRSFRSRVPRTLEARRLGARPVYISSTCSGDPCLEYPTSQDASSPRDRTTSSGSGRRSRGSASSRANGACAVRVWPGRMLSGRTPHQDLPRQPAGQLWDKGPREAREPGVRALLAVPGVWRADLCVLRAATGSAKSLMASACCSLCRQTSGRRTRRSIWCVGYPCEVLLCA